MKKSTYLLVILICCTYLDTLAQGGAKWSVSGNSIDPGDFIGTTNNEDLILKANGTEGLRIKSNGKIDLSTNQVRINPQTTAATNIKFHNSNSQNGGFLIGINSGNNNGNNAIFNLKENRNMIFKTNAVEQMRIDNLGNVGIGTNSLSSRLTVAGTIETTSGGVKFPDGSVQTTAFTAGPLMGTQANPYSELYATDFIKVGTSSLWLGSTLTPGTADLGEFIFTTGTQPLRINGDEGPNTGNIQNTHINPDGGLVGIGTDDPRHTLHSTGNFLIEGDYKSLLFGETPDPTGTIATPNKGQYGIEYEPTERGLNFWKPWGSKKVDQATNGFKNFILFLSDDGVVGINLTNPTDQLITRNTDNYKLIVNGGIRSTRVKVQLEDEWADYVFEEDYDLMPLDEVDKYIQENGHLPNVPSAKQIKMDGLELGEMNVKLMEKIEELTLYMIELRNKNEELSKVIETLKTN